MTLIDLTVPRRARARLATLPVAIIGAGPIGLAAAANLVERGIDFVIFEAGDDIGRQHPAVGSHAALLAVEARGRPRIPAPVGGDRMGAPAPESLPTGTELVEQYLSRSPLSTRSPPGSAPASR